MAEKKFHVGKNGPAPCGANPDKPGGRACRFGETRHGTEAETTAIWESEQEALHGGSLLQGISKSVESEGSMDQVDAEEEMDPLKYLATISLSQPEAYRPHAQSGDSYSQSEVTVAMNLALNSLTELSYEPIGRKDAGWSSEGCSSVQRYVAEDGSTSYFKSFVQNSTMSYLFRSYGTTALEASTNEVNAYRLAKLMGPDFDELIPETTFREVNGALGTIQRGVLEDGKIEPNFITGVELKQDYRKAAILDFVLGTMDRHQGNFLYEIEEDSSGAKRHRIRLIDNSFSFPSQRGRRQFNESIFADNTPPYGYFEGDDYTIPEEELNFTEDELDSLGRARAAVESWMEAKTLGEQAGSDALDRIDFLFESGKLSPFSRYFKSLQTEF